MNVASNMAQRLGLALSPLFQRDIVKVPPGEHFALLDGRSASFACSIMEKPDVSELDSRNWQWSADLAHHVLVSPEEVQVRSGCDPVVRRFNRKSVDIQLEQFLAFLNARRSALPDVVPFLVAEFQRIWAASDSPDGSLALTAFLLSLCAAGETDMDILNDISWCRTKSTEIGLDPDLVQSALSQQIITQARGIPERAPLGLRLIPSLVLRHAAGRLFQEAHAILETVQFDLFESASISTTPNYSPSGAYFTPVSIARMLADWALHSWTGSREHVTIADFACGSGVFLTEALQTLERKGFIGSVRLIGRDKSPQAVTMANVAVRTLKPDFPTISIDCDISQADAFEAEWPNADIVLMNPPFRSWERMNSQERDWVHELVGETGRGRPDLSVAFIERAMRIVNPGGVVATLVPAGVLASESLYKWRDSLAQRAIPTLVAVLGEHGLFQHALVNVGIIALSIQDKPAQALVKTPLYVGWSSAEAGSASKTIRAIRRSMSGTLSGESLRDKTEWSLTATSFEIWKQRPSWLPGAGALGNLLEKIQTNVPTKVGDLFDVHQGSRTGANEVFLRSRKEVHNLPAQEQAYFKPAVDTASFVEGEIRTESYLFCHDPKWKDEQEVSRAVPTFFREYLKPSEPLLRKRKSLLDDRWWELTRARGWMFDGRPRLVSKRFGLYPAFARDFKGSFAVVQANAWLPTGVLTGGQDKDAISETLFAFWWLLNSRVAIALFREFCPNVAGGQLDLENKYVKNVPLPNLLQEIKENPSLQALSISIRTRNMDRLPILSDLDEFAASAYGTALSEWDLSGLELPR